MKKLSYKIRWFDYPDLVPASIEARIKPYLVRSDGSPYYTCPAIIGDATGVSMNDSFKIAQYFDKQYPDTPKALPEGTDGLQSMFEEQFIEVLFPVWTLVPKVPGFLSEISGKYFYDTRSAFLGRPLEQLPVDPEERKEL
ncbi:hypothetical protein AN958_01515 [Leucoagaricus sp. SymC.cos]|nr:hypothetical protein AN958_01515 [Leucoagaricus sp. SymC.cos]